VLKKHIKEGEAKLSDLEEKIDKKIAQLGKISKEIDAQAQADKMKKQKE
jgi:hypothetical protein